MAQEMATDVQADLARRVLAIGGRVRSVGPHVLVGELDTVRRIAHANGLHPAAAVAHALEAALARGERGVLVEGWLAILTDAIGCDRHDRAACETYTAACSVRLAF